MNFQKTGCKAIIIALLVAVVSSPYKMAVTTNLEPVQEAPKPVTITEVDQPKPLTATLPGSTIIVVKEDTPKINQSVSRGGYPPVKVLEGCEITWYNDKGTTKSGAHTEDGVTVAVDPHIIPLGSWIEIHMPDGTMYKRKAQDTGSAVKGKIVDIYLNASNAELFRRGRTKGVIIYILGGG